MKIKVKKINAFSDRLDGGNPAGFVFNPPDLTDKEMSYISKTMNVSETAFVRPGKKSDYNIRFFSPEMEVDLCGHATIASFHMMASENIITPDKSFITQETKAGILPIEVIFSNDKVKRVMMTQKKAILKDIFIDILKVSDSLNIEAKYIDNNLPKQIVSTGLFTFPICVKSFNILKEIKPDFNKVKKLCNKIGSGSLHLFTFDTIEPKSVYHARCFAPLYGINEDPVTGTANGALCFYLSKNKIIDKTKFVCEQGDIMGRPGRVFVDVDKDIVKVGGTAKFVEEKTIKINDF